MAMFLLGMGMETEMGEGGAETKGSPFIHLHDSKPSVCLKKKKKKKEQVCAVLFGLQIKPSPLQDHQLI